MQQGQIYVTDGIAYFSRLGPRIVGSPELLAGILHLDVFPEFALGIWPPGQITRLQAVTSLHQG